MKKFSRTLTASLGVVAALSLSACHPPHQQDSDVKIDNASTFTGVAPAQAEAETTETPEMDPDGMQAEDDTQTLELLEIVETTTSGPQGAEIAVATPVSTETVIIPN